MELDTTNQQVKSVQESPLKQPLPNTVSDQRRFVPVVIGIVILLIIVAGGSYYLGTKSALSPKPDIFQTTPIPTVVKEPTTTNTASPTDATSSTPTSKPVSYTAPSSWKKTPMMNNTLTLCLPPKWEADQWGNVYFNRDAAYRPNVTYIQGIPYSSGSRREAYYMFWETEYPNVRELVSIKETNIGSNTVLTIYSTNPAESKISPDGNLAVVWYANGKLWKAGLSGWNMVNDSQSAFLKDFYTAISCSFTN